MPSDILSKFIPIVLLCASLAEGAPQLTEQQQLDLLEAADEYYQSPERDNATSIALYEEVLRYVELAPPIGHEILFNVGGMLNYERHWSRWPTEDDWLQAAERFVEIADLGPDDNWPVIQTHMFYGFIWGYLGYFEAAAGEYLSAVDLLSRMPPEEFEQFPTHQRKRLRDEARRYLLDMHIRWGLAGVRRLEEVAQSDSVGSEVSKAVQKAAPNWLRVRTRRLPEEDELEILQILEGMMEESNTAQATRDKATPGSNGKPLSKSEIQNRRALSQGYSRGFVGYESTGRIPRVTVPRMFRDTYGLPVSSEGVPDRSAETTLISFGIQRNETLKHALDKFVQATGGVCEWKWIEDTIFIGPRKDGNPSNITSLDAVVSLELESVSVWDAFVALGIAMRRNNPSDYPFEAVQPHCVGVLKAPPREFTEPGHITLSLSNVPARQAACAILKASPVGMYFKYVTGIERDYISLLFFENGKHIPLEMMTESEFAFWDAETKSVRDRLKEISSR